MMDQETVFFVRIGKKMGDSISVRTNVVLNSCGTGNIAERRLIL